MQNIVDPCVPMSNLISKPEPVSFPAKQKQKFETYYFLQLCDLQLLLMNLLILHLQNFFQTLEVLLNVFIWCQSILLRKAIITPAYFKRYPTTVCH